MKYSLITTLVLIAISAGVVCAEKKVQDEKPNIDLPDGMTRKKILGSDGVSRRDPSDIIKVDDTYYIWYTKVVRKDLWSPQAEHYPHGYPGDIWYATSPDGHDWTEQGEAVHKGERNDHDEHGIFTPNILVAGGKYYLFYTAVDEPYVWEHTPTTIGVAVSNSPDGPWKKYDGNPVLRPSRHPGKFDSFRCDDTCFVVRDGKYWMYYKGRAVQRNRTQMGVAIADNPLGPYRKYNEAQTLHSGHEVLVWPVKGGVASFNTYRNSIYFAPDGVSFKEIGKVPRMKAPGLYRNDHFQNNAGMKAQWGVVHGGGVKQGLGLHRVDWIYDEE